MPLHWTALLLGVLAVTPFAAEAALRIYASYIGKPARLFRSDLQTGWSNAPNLRTMLINAAGGPPKNAVTTSSDERRSRKKPVWAGTAMLMVAMVPTPIVNPKSTTRNGLGIVRSQ